MYYINILFYTVKISYKFFYYGYIICNLNKKTIFLYSLNYLL